MTNKPAATKKPDFSMKMIEREKAVPGVGAMAPDFEIERLAGDGSRCGETFRLSSMLGQTVALLFGSYTWLPFR